MRWKYILMGIIVLGCFVLVISFVRSNNENNNNEVKNKDIFVRSNSSSGEFNFEFITSQSKDSIFIENTVVKDIEESASSSGGDWAAATFKEKGGVIPIGQLVFKVDPEFFKNIILNKVSDKYTLVMNDKTFAMTTEGFYYNVDEGCGDDKVSAKLIPDESVDNIDFTKEEFVIIKRPHPKIEKFNIIRLRGSEISEDMKSILVKMLKERFAQFLKATEYFTEGIKASEGYWGGVKTSEISFSEQPEITLYKSESSTGYQFIVAKWHSDAGEMQCCIAGLFEVKETNGKFDLNEAIPVSDGKGVGSIVIDKILQINDRKFVFVEKGYWEWGNEEIYEIIPNQYLWKTYSVSRGTGGC